MTFDVISLSCYTVSSVTAAPARASRLIKELHLWQTVIRTYFSIRGYINVVSEHHIDSNTVLPNDIREKYIQYKYNSSAPFNFHSPHFFEHPIS